MPSKKLCLQEASSLHLMRMDLEPAAAVPCYSCRLAQTMKLLPHIGLQDQDSMCLLPHHSRWTLTAQWYGLATHLPRHPSPRRSYQIRAVYLSSHKQYLLIMGTSMKPMKPIRISPMTVSLDAHLASVPTLCARI